jgi:branched-chain amino acid transport system permease protein
VLERFVETLINALAVGSLYALIALGYTMVYGILKFINFAHSDIFVLGAWTAFAAAGAAGWSATGAPTTISWWIVWALFALPVVAAAVWAYDYIVRPAIGEYARSRLPRLGQTATLIIVAAWSWIILGLVLVARLMRSHPSLELAAGGLILLIAMLTCGVVGFALERMAYKPLRKAPRLNVLITAIGVSLLLQNLGQLNWMFSTSPQRMPSLLPDTVLSWISFGSTVTAADGTVTAVQRVPVRLIDVVVFFTAVVLMVALDWLVFRTKIGRAMRAVSFSPETASLMGIPVDRVISFTFVLGAMLAAAAGFLYGQKYPGLNQPAAAGWVLLGLKAFVAAVVGGIGNIRGAMLGGILIGGLEMFGATYTSPNLRDLYVFGVLILVLLFRPSGILGGSEAEKV